MEAADIEFNPTPFQTVAQTLSFPEHAGCLNRPRDGTGTPGLHEESTMPQSRAQVCESASRKLSAAVPKLSDIRATVGLDGFVDEIIAVVDKRHDFQRFDAITTIEGFGRKIVECAGNSSNYELIVKQMKLGGNGPIMANALAAAGLSVTYVGAVGFPMPHPVFQELGQRAQLVGVGEPGHTDALEFADGKLMLGKYTREMSDINWTNVTLRLGHGRFEALMESSTLIGMVNWTMLPYMSEIWEKMLEAGVPNRAGRQRTLFVDLADPEKRTHADIKHALDLLGKFQAQVDVVLGLNLKEAGEIADVLGLPGGAEEGQIEKTARAIREKLGVACVVIHPRRGAAAATASESAAFAGPFVAEPLISTGAGDHFNAGFCVGRILGLSLEESLCVGVATSGYYVRTAKSPSAANLVEFIAELPGPE
jgi:sugar/nucleoside kinase (ribokinase family)